MAVTAMGLSVANIPVLHTLDLGGRLKHCLLAWHKIGVSDWVYNVLSVGYRIPLKFLPRQNKVLANPPASEDAHDILVATEK